MKSNAVVTKNSPLKRVALFIKRYGRVILGGGIIAAVLFCSVFAPLLTEHDPSLVDLSIQKQPPNAEHILGTDTYGRDLWARLLFGSRSTLIVALGSQLLTIAAGTVLGLLCGYYNKVEKVLMRFLDAFATIPNLLLSLLMVSILGGSVQNLIIAMSISNIPGCARMVRNQVLSLREREFIESEKAMGARDTRTIFVHILPHCFSYLIVEFTSGLAGAVLSMTSLSYLGIGLSPTIPSWGGIIQESQAVLFSCPHIILYASLAICITIFGFSILGDGVRDILDPKLK